MTESNTPVTGADREAAARIIGMSGDYREAERAILRLIDCNHVVQAFARHREATTATLTAQVEALTAERDALREALRKLDNAASMVCQWRSTIMVRFDGQIDFGQWSGLHNSFDRLEDGRVHARAALASTSEGE